MSKSTTSVLLSALLLPGAGQLYLKHFGRGMAFVGTSLVCLWFIIDRAMQLASTVLEKIETQGGGMDVAHVSGLLAQTSNGPESPAATAAALVLAVTWLTGIIDAYKLGKKQN